MEDDPLILVDGRQWFRERFDGVADVVLDVVFREEKDRPEAVRSRREWRESVHESAEYEGDLAGWMLDGRWVCVDLYEALWERLRRLRRAADWPRAPLWLRMALVHVVLYRTFVRCAVMRTHDYRNAAIPPEPAMEFLDADLRPRSLDFNDVPPVRRYGPSSGEGF